MNCNILSHWTELQKTLKPKYSVIGTINNSASNEDANVGNQTTDTKLISTVINYTDNVKALIIDIDKSASVEPKQEDIENIHKEVISTVVNFTKAMIPTIILSSTAVSYTEYDFETSENCLNS